MMVEFIFAAGLMMCNLTGPPKEIELVASWYCEPGKIMAYDNRLFDENDETIIASRDYPNGTALRLTNKLTNQTADGVVCDHGPNVEGRDLDVCKKLAAKLGFEDAGHATLKVEMLPKAP